MELAPAPREARRERFSMGLEELQVAVARGCAAASGTWASRYSSGIRAALAFAASNPEAARALVDARADDPERTDDYRRLIDGLSAQLRECSPAADRRLPLSSEETLVENIAGVVNGCLRSGEPERLEEIAPYLVYMALLPHVGFAEAWRLSGLVE